MAIQQLNVRIAIWDDTPANWASTNPILLKSEIGIERGTTVKMKIGDGVTTWNNLPYYGNGVIISTTAPTSSDYQHSLGTFWIRNNDNNSPNRCYYLESLSGSVATWRKVITDQDLANFALASHTHGNITNDGKIGSNSGKVITTAANGVLQAEDQRTAFNKDFESVAGNILMNGSAAAGASGKIADAAHRHPSDTTKINTSEKGAANGVATLGADGKVPSGQLPSFVDDVIDIVDFLTTLPSSGLTVGNKYIKTSDNKIYTATTTTTFDAGVNPEQGVIYTRLSNNVIYRWSGSAYISISNPIDLATQAEAEAGTENSKAMTAMRVFQAILKWIQTKTLSFFGTFTPSNSAISGSDTILSAFAKAQGQINNKENLLKDAPTQATFTADDRVVIIRTGDNITYSMKTVDFKVAAGIFGVDNATIEVNGNNVRIKDLGVTTAKIANNAVTKAKIASVAVRALDLDGDTLVLNGGNA